MSEGKTNKYKGDTQSIFFNGWFWVIGVILIAILGFSLSRLIENQSSAESGEKLHKIGDTVKIDNVAYTLNNVEVTSEKKPVDGSNSSKVIKVTYTIKNNGNSEIPKGSDVTVYGPADAYEHENNTREALAPGKQVKTVAYFTLPQTGDIEVRFSLPEEQKTDDSSNESDGSPEPKVADFGVKI